VPIARAEPQASGASIRALRRRLEAPPKLDLVAHMGAVLAGNPAAWPAMLSEIRGLSEGPGHLTTDEYFYYRLYESALSFAEKARFVGKRAQGRIHADCNDPSWHALAHDKLLFHAMMTELGFPVPRLLATYRAKDDLADVPQLESPAELEDFLRHRLSYPCFAKPVDGMFSLGAYGLQSHDDADDALVLASGERMAVPRFVQEIHDSDYAGYLFQERLAMHAALAGLVGERVATVRLILLLTGHGPEIFRALCKIPVGAHMADNFWRTGNMAAAVDPDSGQILRAVSGVGLAQRLHARHPDTGKALVGTVLPSWSEVKSLCLAAAAALPGLRIQSWDVAIGRDGPVLVEVNAGGDLNLPQIAFGQGMLDARFTAHVAACARDRRHAS
jgi:hypothetical protein